MAFSANIIIMITTTSSVFGAVILYFLGRLLGIDGLEKIINKYGNIVKLNQENIHRASWWFHKYGVYAVFFCRMIPIVRTFISIPAGITKMNFPLYFILTTMGHFIGNSILVNIVFLFISSLFQGISNIGIDPYKIYRLLFIVFPLFVVLYGKKVRKKRMALRNE